LSFVVAGKPAFHVPISTIHNSAINKTEVTLEFLPPEMPEAGSRRKGLGDQLMEMRLYIPGSEAAARKRAKQALRDVEKTEMDVDLKKEDEEELATEDEEGGDMNAADVFHEAIKERAELGMVQGEAIVMFSDVACATPRCGRVLTFSSH
jgi:structure-specific recognition protein 1